MPSPEPYLDGLRHQLAGLNAALQPPQHGQQENYLPPPSARNSWAPALAVQSNNIGYQTASMAQQPYRQAPMRSIDQPYPYPYPSEVALGLTSIADQLVYCLSNMIPQLSSPAREQAQEQTQNPQDPLIQQPQPGADEEDTEEDDDSDDGKTQMTNDKERTDNVNGITGKKISRADADRSTRIRIMINRWNDKESKWEEKETTVTEDEGSSDKAATYRRYMDADNPRKLDSEEIEIHSKPLMALIAETDKFWVDNSFITETSPFYTYVWKWDEYVRACKFQKDDPHDLREARKALKEVLHRIKSCKSLESYFRSRDQIHGSKKIKFEHLWTIFPHGCRIYARSYLKELQLFEVIHVDGPPLKGESFKITCSAFDWNGTRWSNYTYVFSIKSFTGEKFISSLDAFPAKFYCDQNGNTDDSKLRSHLRERGAKYYDFCANQPTQCKYQGAALVSPSGPQRLTTGPRRSETEAPFAEQVDVTSIEMNSNQSRVVIDNYAFVKSLRNPMKCGDVPPLWKQAPVLEAGCVCKVCKSSPLNWKHPEDGENDEEFSASEDRLMSLPPRILGFSLKEKVWGQFLVDKLEKVVSRASTNRDENMTPFKDDLQLETEHKEQLMALVNYHRPTDSRKQGDEAKKGEKGVGMDARSFDVIEGKGQGLAILLHGPPGVGKTLTAETIAIATGRPLLSISVAEIGVEATIAEQRLSDVFEDAARWEAILLMDEADVFLEERRKSELARNALVSVLLRCLEYYDGIIFLTTNRVRSIDAAMQSRINLAIQYKDLDKEQILAIYKNRLKYIPDEEFEDRESLEEGLAESPCVKKGGKLNGRQIRNIVTGARGLAKSNTEKLDLKHLVKVYETTLDFIKSMAAVVEAQRAKNELD